MKVRRSLPLMLVIILTLVISPSLGTQMSAGISSRGIINYPEEPNHLPRLRVEGKYIKDDFGRTVYLKGVSFRDYDWWTLGHATEDQFRYMKEWGANVVRITIAGRSIPEWRTDPSFRSKMDDMISWAERHGLYVVLSGYHVWAGGSTQETNSDLSWWGDTQWNFWIEHWKDIATRYKGRTNVLYDLINEPYHVSWATYQAEIRACIDAIRAIDPDVICIVESMSADEVWGHNSLEFEKEYPIERPNIVFSPHTYYRDPTKPTSKEAIRDWPIHARFWDWCLENNRPVWIGECNALSDTFPQGGEWLRNFYGVLNEDGYAGWAAWNWGAPPGVGTNLCTDWNGSPSLSGSILQEYLGS